MKNLLTLGLLAMFAAVTAPAASCVPVTVPGVIKPPLICPVTVRAVMAYGVAVIG